VGRSDRDDLYALFLDCADVLRGHPESVMSVSTPAKSETKLEVNLGESILCHALSL